MKSLIEWWHNRHKRRTQRIRKQAEEYARMAFNIEYINNLYYVTFNGVVVSLPHDTEHTDRLRQLRDRYVEDELHRYECK